MQYAVDFLTDTSRWLRDESNCGAKSWNRQHAFHCLYFFLNDRILESPSVSE